MKILLIFFIFILMFIGKTKKTKKIINNALFIIYFGLMVYSLYILKEISPDYLPYKVYYDDAILNNYFYNYELGFRYLNKVIYLFAGNNYDMVFLIYYMLISYFYLKAANYFCENNSFSLAIIVILFIVGLSGIASILIRQFLSISLGFYATTFLFKKKVFLYFILFSIAVTLHIT
ncbi:EpsG family protein, partial [Turicibacter sanguinis]